MRAAGAVAPPAAFALCARLHGNLRALLGPPDLILHLTTPLAVVEARYARRGRPLEIAQRDDLALMDSYIVEWIAGAEEVAGSWWTDWSNWLQAHAGKQIAG